jgi:hypothetical protein
MGRAGIAAAAIAPLLLAAVPAVAAGTIVTDPALARSLIAGDSERVWIREAVIAALGGEACEAGVRYRFRQDATARIETCVDGAWSTSDAPWTLSGGGTGLFTLTLDGQDFTATLVDTPERLELILLTLPGQKDEPTVEVELTYEKDD